MNKIYKLKLADNTPAIIFKSDKYTKLVSENYNFIFDRKTGFFARFGKTKEEDGDLNVSLPEIADIEISTICHGIDNIPCAFCYKSNTGRGQNMTLETFKKVFEKLPPSVGQIAFGVGSLCANPELFEIFDHCIENGVVPNVTINGENVTDEIANKLVQRCGAISVSIYDKDKSYDAVKKLTDRGLKQVNIHFMISKQTLEKAYEVLNDIKTDSRLEKLNAIVFLSLKQKGRATSVFKPLSQDEYKKLIIYALENNISFGSDSCGAQKILNSIEGIEKYNHLNTYIEKCESTLYSSYINVEGKFFPCSFIEDTNGWKEGLDVINCNNFLKDIWNHPKTLEFKNKLLTCERNCPIYNI